MLPIVQTAEEGPWVSVKILSVTTSARGAVRGYHEWCRCKSGLEVGFKPGVNFEHRSSLVIPQRQLALALAYKLLLGDFSYGRVSVWVTG